MKTPTASMPNDDLADWVREKQLLKILPVSRAWLHEVRNQSWLRVAKLKSRPSNDRGIVLYHVPTILTHLDGLADGEKSGKNPPLPEGGDK